MSIEPTPSLEEAAAIAAALAALGGSTTNRKDAPAPRRDRWRLAGLLGHPPPPQMKLEGALWSYSSWEGMT